MIDIDTEDLLTLSEAAQTLPNRPHVGTLHRWHLRGVRGHRLETCLVGNLRVTSRQALARFISRITAAASGEAMPVRTPRQRQRARDLAERSLADDGI